MSTLDKTTRHPAPAALRPASRPAPRPASRPDAAKPAAPRPSVDALELVARQEAASLRRLEQLDARRDALEAKNASLRNWSQGAGLLGFCTMIAAGAAGPALPFVMGAGLLLMTAVPAALYVAGAGARKELARLDAASEVY